MKARQVWVHRWLCRVALCVGALAAFAGAAAPAAVWNPPVVPAPAEVLARLRPEHPRVLLTPEVRAAIREATPGESLQLASLRSQADTILSQPAAEYGLPDGLRMTVASTVLRRVETLAMAYLVLADDAHLDRLWQELEAGARFPDWNPHKHFLDTAAMVAAFGIAYDWLYDEWTPAQRHVIRTALVEKGLKPGEAVYRKTPGTSPWWITSPFNWNLVCSGGLTLGALAVADEEPALAGYIVSEAVRAIPHALQTFGPDGGWPESVGYWHYSVQYLVPHLAALETALGTDFGLSEAPGLAETASFPVHMTGPTQQVFNFADGSTSVVRAPEMLWLASRYKESYYAQWYRQLVAGMGGPRDLLWGYDLPGVSGALALPLDAFFHNVQIATMRSAWNDDQALYVGFKAGDNSAGHANLDLGSFVLDALGVRWAEDLGPDDYNLPGYFSGNSRWSFYRCRAEGHNTLVINPDGRFDQDPRGKATIAYQASAGGESMAIADLTQAYQVTGATRAERGIALFDSRRQVLVQDEIQTRIPSEVWWFMHTQAGIELSGDGSTAVLTVNSRLLVARILSPAGARFTVLEAEPLSTSPTIAGQHNNAGYRKLAIHLHDVRDTRIAVLLTPVWPEAWLLREPAVKPLRDWQHGLLAEYEPLLPERISLSPEGTSYHPASGVVDLSFGIPAAMQVDQAEVLLDGVSVGHLDTSRGMAALDTRSVPDGLHLLTIRSRRKGGASFAHWPWHTANWWKKSDPMNAPVSAGWFGLIDTRETSQVSAGWAYQTEGPVAALDNSRRIRVSDTEEYLQFEAPNLRDVQVRVYTLAENVDAQVRLLVSSDGTTWTDMPYVVEAGRPTYQGWRELQLICHVSAEMEAEHFRLLVLPGPIGPSDLQVGLVEMAGLFWRVMWE